MAFLLALLRAHCYNSRSIDPFVHPPNFGAGVAAGVHRLADNRLMGRFAFTFADCSFT